MPSFFKFRSPCLLRGNVLVLGSLAAAFFIANFPADRATPAIIVPIAVAAFGMAETFRCIRARWSWYHGAVMISLYMDLMALALILFLAFYPLMSPFK